MKNSEQRGTPTGAMKFVTTRWSVVVDAGESGSQASRDALALLCDSYWSPLYAYTRRQGNSPAESQDLTQEFFAYLIRTNFIASASRERGRFRSFLLVAFKRFLINEWKKSRAQKRGGGASMISLDADEAETRYLADTSNACPADQLYDQRWALALLDKVLESLRAEFVAEGREDFFESLKTFLYGEQGAQTQAELGARFGLSVSAVKAAVHRLRERYRRRLREEVADTVASPAEVDDELRHLLAVLSR